MNSIEEADKRKWRGKDRSAFRGNEKRVISSLEGTYRDQSDQNDRQKGKRAQQMHGMRMLPKRAKQKKNQRVLAVPAKGVSISSVDMSICTKLECLEGAKRSVPYEGVESND